MLILWLDGGEYGFRCFSSGAINKKNVKNTFKNCGKIKKNDEELQRNRLTFWRPIYKGPYVK